MLSAYSTDLLLAAAAAMAEGRGAEDGRQLRQRIFRNTNSRTQSLRSEEERRADDDE